MIDLIKKTMLAGLGATVVTKDKIESTLHEYVEKGRLSAGDAQNLAERIVADGRQEFEQTKRDLSERFNDLLKKSNFATREELTALEKRFAAHEALHDCQHEPKHEAKHEAKHEPKHETKPAAHRSHH
jgi:polyhydroxyalkanoate synthesis regulator phasin